ncbi:hypothetical protein [Streptomyces sp. FIT100]|uniref:hypothetical protein n=1 Tax=Streptomyces sp. FIT100 TaxID=2837956 RepID=UPI0021C5A33B|nr:hypothetical protein [Streptomyces sp. FIT100]UUN25202.1 hypothetical protein KK483_01275 [Streptomyces sp. FIT100]
MPFPDSPYPDTDRGAPDGGLTTEDLARPGQATAPDESAPLYPGEATPVRGATEEPAGDERPADAEADAEADSATAAPGAETGQPLIDPAEAEAYRDRWQEIQGTFVDDPKDSVHAADALVAEVIQSLAATFADHKKDLESQWSRGEEVETEDLRVALQRYRSFFNQLLHT